MKVVVAVSLNPELNVRYKKLQSTNWLLGADVYLVNVFHTHNYILGTEDIPLAYPIEKDVEEIKSSTVKYLKRVGREIFSQIPENKLHCVCLFNDDPKHAFCDYVNEVGADLTIVLTRSKRGLFESSFGQYVSRHSNSNVLFLKESNEDG